MEVIAKKLEYIAEVREIQIFQYFRNTKKKKVVGIVIDGVSVYMWNIQMLNCPKAIRYGIYCISLY